MENYTVEEIRRSRQRFMDVADDLSGSGMNTFADRLSLFMEYCGNDEVFQGINRQLTSVDFDSWYAERKSTKRGVAGSGQQAFPRNRDERSSLLYQLLWRIDSGEINLVDFLNTFFSAGGNEIDSLVYAFNKTIVKPLSRELVYRFEYFLLNKHDLVLISNNCWGSELYYALRREYNTPFVGLFLFAECYIDLLENFEGMIYSELEFSATSRYFSSAPSYPIGMLGGRIEIHFLHYPSEREAFDKWNRRIARLKMAMDSNVPVFVKFCDRDGCTINHLARFHATQYQNKISIGINRFDALNHFHQPKLKDPQGEFVIDGLELYRKRYDYFDITDWIASGRMRRS